MSVISETLRALGRNRFASIAAYRLEAKSLGFLSIMSFLATHAA